MIWLLQNVVFSISLIVILHYLYIYFKATLTSPKVKDLIYCPKQKYETLFNTIEQGNRGSGDHGSGDHGSGDLSSSIVPQGTFSLGIPSIIANNNTSSDPFQFVSQYSYNNVNNVDNGNNTSAQPDTMNQSSQMKSELKAYLKTLGLKKQSGTSSRASSSLTNRAN